MGYMCWLSCTNIYKIKKRKMAMLYASLLSAPDWHQSAVIVSSVLCSETAQLEVEILQQMNPRTIP